MKEGLPGYPAHTLGYLKDEETVQKKNEIKDRLNALRQGPFGERRLNAKQRVIEKGEAV